MRRVHLRHRDNILKRILIQYAALNLSLLLRHSHGKGTPRGHQGQCVEALLLLILRSATTMKGFSSTLNRDWSDSRPVARFGH